MGLFPQCKVYRFIDNLTEDQIENEARKLLSAFFETMGVRTVQHFSGSYSVNDAVDKFPLLLTRPNQAKLKKSAPEFPSRETYRRASEDEKYPQRTRDFFAQMAEGKTTMRIDGSGISTGLSFHIDKNENEYKSPWDLYLHRSPLPLLEMEICHGYKFKPTQGWNDAMLNNSAAHVVWID
ncbi:MAG TPA: hypothetical protein VK810_00085, partial [Dongiaceae bacterium]|nr:hypothetical protein [Dongiaceae bacterium]